ncbi:hypothetical protein CPB83DRAFT_899255 [Crepidotus variabilis]|uniref:Uncharacterized protein n=1 Tax=Crepidotus variabilis TaxID=179855 RepID=A0A9P6E5H4_9AGAR|nr:hypothetical protein CPB83DRAFT_899255 [Crepidotus variabilis]
MPFFSKLALSDLSSSSQSCSQPVLDNPESEWKDLYIWLFSCGYRLCSQYQPSCSESVEQTAKVSERSSTRPGPKKPYAHPDATHIISNTQAVLQRVEISEVEVALYLQGFDDPFNPILPVLEILEHPTDSSIRILVQPLFRPVFEPGFETIGEVLDFIYQAFKGLQYLRERNIDLGQLGLFCSDPIVMVPSPSMYPDSYNFMSPRYSPSLTQRARPAGPRTIFQPKYYWRLSNISRCADPKDPKTKDLFAGDVGALGRLIENEFMVWWRGGYCENMRHLIGTSIYPLHSLRLLSSYPEHPNPYLDADLCGISLCDEFDRHSVGNPHLNPLSDIYSPTHPEYERSPLSRLMRNMLLSVYLERPTIFEATRAL